VRMMKPEFHCADFPETSPSGEVGVMEFGLDEANMINVECEKFDRC